MTWLMSLNPVLVKELRGRMRGARAFVVLTIYLLVLAITMTLFYLAIADVAGLTLDANQAIGRALFLFVTVIALIQVCIVVPSQAASALTSEKESETYDLLISTLLPPWKIVLGKLLAALAYALLLIIAVVPLMALSFFFGGVTIREVLLALLGLLVTCILFGSIGLTWSALVRRSLVSTTLTQATNAALLLGIPFLSAIFLALFVGRWPPPAWTTSAPINYLWMAWLCLHPFIALGVSEMYLSQGETRLFFPVNEAPMEPFAPMAEGSDRPATFLMLHPWLLFTIEALLLSLVLIALSIRWLRPLDERPGRRRRAQRA